MSGRREKVTTPLREAKEHADKTPTVAFDIDDTLAEVNPVLLSAINNRKKTTHTFNDVLDSEMTNDSLWFDYINMYRDLWINRYAEIRLLADAGLLKKVEEYYAVSLISARGKYSRTTQGLKKWLARHSLDHLPLVITETSDAKADYDYDVFVDDYAVPVNFRQKLLLLHKYYNKNVTEAENVMRFEGVNEAMRWLIDTAKKR